MPTSPPGTATGGTTGGGPSATGNSRVNYANYANFVAQTLLAAKTGTVPTIPNALASGQLDTAILTDPVRIQAYRTSIATQMNDQSGGPKFEDLSERIADVVIDTVAQGAGTLEVHLIDPFWTLLISGFIQVDQNGYLWPPIDINFPSGTDCVWRLCQARAAHPPTEANLVLTFEDRIVSLLREMSALDGVQQGLPNQTLGGFIKMLVDNANKTLKGNIRLVELISPQDPNYTVPITNLPKSAQGPLRQNPAKLKTGTTLVQHALISSIQQLLSNVFSGLATTTIAHVESTVSSTDWIPNETYIPGLGTNGR